MTMIELSHIEKSYRLGNNDVRALRGLSLHVPKGAFVALMGASGSGKTSLLNIVGCLDAPTKGTFRLDGDVVDLSNHDRLAPVRAQKIGFVFQAFNLLPVLTAVENVELPMMWHPKPLAADARRARARALLDAVGLGAHLDRRPSALSGGQQQRVAIARAFANSPRLVLADEPTANLDTESADNVLDAMVQLWRKESATFLLATHDPRILARATQVVYLVDGVVGLGPMHDPESEMFNRPYFEARVDEEARRSARHADALAIVAVRVAAADVRAASAALRAVVRASDTAARVQSDAFGILLAGADLDECALAQKRIAAALAGAQVSATFGSAQVDVATKKDLTAKEASELGRSALDAALLASVGRA
jgi:putative ABC transport system ATP-binding protein